MDKLDNDINKEIEFCIKRKVKTESREQKHRVPKWLERLFRHHK